MIDKTEERGKGERERENDTPSIATCKKKPSYPKHFTSVRMNDVRFAFSSTPERDLKSLSIHVWIAIRFGVNHLTFNQIMAFLTDQTLNQRRIRQLAFQQQIK
jgi:hypothetical protein